MATLEFSATRLEVDPDVRILSFGNDESDVGIVLSGSEDPFTLSDVQFWYGADDGNRTDRALKSAKLEDGALHLELTARGAAVAGDHDRVRISIDVPEYERDAEVRAITRVLRILFESDPSKLDVAEPSRRRSAKPAAPAAVAPSAALVTLLTERELIVLATDARPDDLAADIAPLLTLTPESLATESVVEFLFDDPRVDEVFAPEDVLEAIVREFLE